MIAIYLLEIIVGGFILPTSIRLREPLRPSAVILKDRTGRTFGGEVAMNSNARNVIIYQFLAKGTT